MESKGGVEKLDRQWDQMDDLGYAGKMGSNKPALTKELVEARESKIFSSEESLKMPENQQPMLIPQTQEEKMNIADANLKPDGTRKSRHKKTPGFFHPIDASRGMDGIGRNRGNR